MAINLFDNLNTTYRQGANSFYTLERMSLAVRETSGALDDTGSFNLDVTPTNCTYPKGYRGYSRVTKTGDRRVSSKGRRSLGPQFVRVIADEATYEAGNPIVGALYFNGTDAYVTWASALGDKIVPINTAGNGKYHMASLWVRCEGAPSGTQTIFSIGSSGTLYAGFHIWLVDNAVKFIARTQAEAVTTLTWTAPTDTSDAFCLANRWHHILAVANFDTTNNGVLWLYVDGVKKQDAAVATNDNTSQFMAPTSADPSWKDTLGCKRITTTNTEFFKGWIGGFTYMVQGTSAGTLTEAFIDEIAEHHYKVGIGDITDRWSHQISASQYSIQNLRI